MRKLATFIVFLLLATTAFAHTPVITPINSETNPVIVTDPETSKAYYGELQGAANFYQITSNKSFDFYLNLLVPYAPTSYNKEFSALVLDDKRIAVTLLEESQLGWKPYFEEFSGVSYLQGPEFRKTLEPGTYTIKIYSTDNTGKYVLAIGEKEDLGGIITNSFTVYPFIKESFFGQNMFVLFFNMLGIVIAFGAIIFIYFLLYRVPRDLRKPIAGLEGKIKNLLWTGTILTIITWLLIFFRNTSNMFVTTAGVILLIIILNQLSLRKLMTKRRKRMALAIILWLLFLFITVLAI